MIARTWRGRTRAADAEAYAHYVQNTGLNAYAATAGNQGAWLLWRIDGDQAEFLTVSFWDSIDSIRAFAGDIPEQAVFYAEDDKYLVDRDLQANHYQILGPDSGTGVGQKSSPIEG